MLNGSAAKFLTAVLGVIASSLTTYYGTQKWEPIIVMACTAISVYLIPNTNWKKAAPVPSSPPILGSPIPPSNSQGV